MSNYGDSFNTAGSSSQKIVEAVEQDKKALQRLRNNVLNLNKVVENLCSKEANVDNAKKTFKIFADQIQRDYEDLETNALSLQQHLLVNPEMSRLQTFLLDALADPSNSEIYNKAVKVANSHETSMAYYAFAIEFLKFFTPAQNARKPTKLTPQIYYNNQINFEEHLQKWVTAPGKINLFKLQFLEQSACGSVAELRIFHQTNISGGVLKMKMLFLINNGQFEYVQIVAPHEEWCYRDASRTQIDISVPSKYESYQRLSESANATCSMLSNYAQLDSKVYINHFLAMFTKIPTFEYKCKNCNKYLRDFMPALIDQRDRRACYHQSCR